MIDRSHIVYTGTGYRVPFCTLHTVQLCIALCAQRDFQEELMVVVQGELFDEQFSLVVVVVRSSECRWSDGRHSRAAVPLPPAQCVFVEVCVRVTRRSMRGCQVRHDEDPNPRVKIKSIFSELE